MLANHWLLSTHCLLYGFYWNTLFSWLLILFPVAPSSSSVCCYVAAGKGSVYRPVTLALAAIPVRLCHHEEWLPNTAPLLLCHRMQHYWQCMCYCITLSPQFRTSSPPWSIQRHDQLCWATDSYSVQLSKDNSPDLVVSSWTQFFNPSLLPRVPQLFFFFSPTARSLSLSPYLSLILAGEASASILPVPPLFAVSFSFSEEILLERPSSLGCSLSHSHGAVSPNDVFLLPCHFRMAGHPSACDSQFVLGCTIFPCRLHAGNSQLLSAPILSLGPFLRCSSPLCS
jgi:hypothetical protein